MRKHHALIVSPVVRHPGPCRQLRQKVIWAAVLFALLQAHAALAELKPAPGTQGNDIPLINEAGEQKIDDTHQQASMMLLTAADWIDSFFNDDRYLLEENKTRAKLRLSFGYTRFDHFEFRPRVDLRVKLPKLSKKAFLIISSSDDDDFDADGKPISNRPRNEDSEGSDLSASLRYFLKVGEQYHVSTIFGASFAYLYGGLRYRYEYDFGPWQGRLANTVKWYTDDGWENKASIDMERHFSAFWFFRASGKLDWYAHAAGLPHALVLNVFQVVNAHSALLYEVGNYFDTDPSHKMTDLLLRVRYRQRFYRDWLAFEVAPQVSFPEAHDRRPNPGIVFRVEADFGYMMEQDAFQTVFGF
jgi:hypothetical protein